MGEAMILEMLERPKDLKQERKGGGGEVLLEGWWERFSLMCLPQRNLQKQVERLPETNKLWLCVSQQSQHLTEKTDIHS